MVINEHHFEPCHLGLGSYLGARASFISTDNNCCNDSNTDRDSKY